MAAALSWGRLLACASFAALSAQAAVVTRYSDVAGWTAAAGAPIASQDFGTYAVDTPMSGVEFLPGVSATSNLTNLRIFSDARRELFGTGGTAREDGEAYYQIDYALPYLAAAFDISAFEANPNNASTAQGPGTMQVFFSDGSDESFAVSGTADPTYPAIFFGIVADTPITRIRWLEALEGSGGNEETGLDNFRVGPRVAAVPEPSSALLAAGGLLALVIRRSRAARTR
jgi:hypothetical protein